MKLYIRIIDGCNLTYSLTSYGESERLIGYHYPLHDVNVQLLEDTKCETDLHYYERPSKPAIPNGSVVRVKDYWFNFYGSYFRVFYNGAEYDVPVCKCAVIL